MTNYSKPFKIKSMYKETNIKEINTILSCMDYTNLSNGASLNDIMQDCRKIIELPDKFEGIATPTGFCVYPLFVHDVHKRFKHPQKTIAVAGGFPSSLTFTKVKINEVDICLKMGADEVDLVMPIGLLQDENYVFEEIKSIKELMGEKTLKVIIESSILQEPQKIESAATIAMEAGADFIKTSTGKDASIARKDDVITICHSIQKFHKETGIKKGIKVSGGIKNHYEAIVFMHLIKEKLGEDWIKPELFRIGASKLANDLINKFISLKGQNVEQKLYF